MDKLKMHSPNITDDNIQRIRDLFPGCVTEVQDENGQLKLAVDFDQLKQELSGQIVEGPQERYHLNWPGKREALLTANAPIAKTLRPCKEESVDFDTTQNLFIEGDNLEALKLLQETYLGKVKMIYIDPPYNTGNDFIYEDDFAENTDEFLTRSNQKDEAGNRLVANTESNGRFHSDWLSMVYSRLKLSRHLLRDDGLVFISIDDDELNNLRKVCDEVFGESNFVATLVWDRNRKNDAKYFSVGHEYMVVYFKNKNFVQSSGTMFRAPKEGVDELTSIFSDLLEKYNEDWDTIKSKILEYYSTISNDDLRAPIKRFRKFDRKGPYRDDGNINWPGGNGPTYEVIHPLTRRPCKQPISGWRFPTIQRFWDEYENGRIVFGSDELTVPRIRTNLFENNDQVMKSVHYSYAQTATNKFLEIFGGVRVFENPKPVADIIQLVRYVTDKDDIVLDFFAGSATTAHAAIQLNAKDGGNRKFIMVQLPEVCDEKSEAFKAGYKTIAEISKERIRRAGAKVLEAECHENWNKDVGFRVLKIDSSNMADTYYTPDAIQQGDLLNQVDNVKSGRDNPHDLLFQVLLDLGVDLTLPITEQILHDKTVLLVNHAPYDLIACFDQNISEALVKELADLKPLRLVFRDNGFASDAVKNNVEQIVRQLSPHTDVKAI